MLSGVTDRSIIDETNWNCEWTLIHSLIQQLAFEVRFLTHTHTHTTGAATVTPAVPSWPDLLLSLILVGSTDAFFFSIFVVNKYYARPKQTRNQTCCIRSPPPKKNEQNTRNTSWKQGTLKYKNIMKYLVDTFQ